jgi:transcriptional regulator with XRE-family HTH domain
MANGVRRSVREFLARTDRTQASFAEELGISEAHLSQVLTGSRSPSLQLAVKIANLSGIRVEEFCATDRVVDSSRSPAA